jgi:hypothetical protein
MPADVDLFLTAYLGERLPHTRRLALTDCRYFYTCRTRVTGPTSAVEPIDKDPDEAG